MKKIIRATYYSLLVLALPLVASAQIKLEDPLKLDTNDPVGSLAIKVINALLGVAGVAALLSFIYGGILWMTAGLSADNIKKGKTVMIWAVFGLLVIFSSYAVITFIFTALGASK